jgi:hypothetical protein
MVRYCVSLSSVPEKHITHSTRRAETTAMGSTTVIHIDVAGLERRRKREREGGRTRKRQRWKER